MWASILLNLVTLLPVLIPLYRKFVPKILPKILVLFGGAGIGGKLARIGWIGAVLGFLSKAWGFLARFPGWFRNLFAFGGPLFFIRWSLFAVVCFFRHPAGWFAILVLSSIFPVILEKIFLVVGAVCLRMFLVIFKMGKSAIMGVSSSEGGLGAFDDFRDIILGSFDELPSCMVEVMGYLHVVEDLGMFITLFSVLVVVSVFKIVYGGFITDRPRL